MWVNHAHFLPTFKQTDPRGPLDPTRKTLATWAKDEKKTKRLRILGQRYPAIFVHKFPFIFVQIFPTIFVLKMKPMYFSKYCQPYLSKYFQKYLSSRCRTLHENTIYEVAPDWLKIGIFVGNILRTIFLAPQVL